MKKYLFLALSCLYCAGIFAQTETPPKDQSYKDWVKEAPKFEDTFLKTSEAARIAENVLLYQQTTGGWPKNIRMQNELTDKERTEAL